MITNRQKTQYQRNILLGQLVALAVTASTLLILSNIEDESVRIDIDRAVFIDKMISKNPSDIISQNIHDISSGSGPKGFSSISAIQSPPSRNENDYGRIIAVNIMHELTSKTITNLPVDNSYLYIDSTSSTDLLHLGTPDADGWPIRNPHGYDYANSNFNSNRSFQPKAANRALSIDFVSPRYPRQAYGINGSVTLDIQTNENGNIVFCNVVKEEPPKRGFAAALKEAIYNSWIESAVINGRKARSRFSLTYEFCWDCSRPSTTYKATDGIVISFKR